MNLPRDKSTIINKLSERLDNLYPDLDDKEGLGIIHWKGKFIIPVKEWKKIAFVEEELGFSSNGLEFFPDDLVEWALLIEGHSVDPYDESIYPYHDGDLLPGTDEFKWFGPKSKLSAAELELWQTRLEERYAKAKKEDPFDIWVQEYKELLEYKNIQLPEYDDERIF